MVKVCLIIQIYTKIFSITQKTEKLYCVICGKYRKSEKAKISYLLKKTLFLFITCRKCKDKDEKLFKEEEWVDILKIIWLIEVV